MAIQFRLLPLCLLLACVDEPELETIAGEVEAPCRVVEQDRVYHCPSQELPASAEFLYMKGASALYAGSLTGTLLSDAPVFPAPAGWTINQSSISPTRKLVLVTMSKSGGRGVLWLGFYKDQNGQKYYELTNLARYYGDNSNIVGWHTWLTTKKVLFNAKINPDGVPLQPDPLRGNGFAYVIDFEHDATRLLSIKLSLWGGTINSENCFVGRMHASMPPGGYTDRCAAGQRVVFARRCFDEPIGPQNYSWFNTKNDDGTGGQCRADAGPSQLVPVFKNYVVTLDANCNPTNFDRTKPIRTPDYTGRYRHMGSNPEWGDGQPTISFDGQLVAFWSRKSSTLASNTNCAGLESPDGSLGDGADRVRVCVLDAQAKCSSIVNLPEPTNAWFRQGGAYFHPMDNGHPGVILAESDGGKLIDLFTNVRTKVLNGWGGHPVLPR